MNDLNSRRILDPADAERLAQIEDTDEIADTIAEFLGLVILRPDDYDPKKVVSYVYLWINFTRLRAGAVPFLYIGSRRFSGDPATDNYQGSNVSLNRDQAKGDDFQRYILETFEVDDGKGAYDLEAVILHDLDVMASVEFYNMSNSADGFDSETGSAARRKYLENPENRKRHSEAMKDYHKRNPNQAYTSKKIFKEYWSDPKNRQKQSDRKKKSFSDPEIKEKHRKACIEAAKRPDVRAKRLAQLEKIHSDPEMRAKRLAQLEKIHSDPEMRAKNLAQLERINSDPEILAKRNAAINRPDVKKKHSDNLKKSWQDPKIAAARRHPFHQAHISYYDEWSRRAETGDFEHCDTCGKVITVEPIRASQKITCFFCENPLQDA